MKRKRTSRSHKQTRPRKKAGARTRSSKRRGPRPSVIPTPNPPVPNRPSSIDGCEEVEVGDIGGFGNVQELEAHEKRCGQQATEFCYICDRHLCSSHYELLHRDHDTTTGHNIGQG